jgi:hypothetical protein
LDGLSPAQIVKFMEIHKIDPQDPLEVRTHGKGLEFFKWIPECSTTCSSARDAVDAASSTINTGSRDEAIVAQLCKVSCSCLSTSCGHSCGGYIVQPGLVCLHVC